MVNMSSKELLISKEQKKGLVFVVLLNFLQSFGRLSFAILGIRGGIDQFLDAPVSDTTSLILHVMFLFLGASGLVATYGLWKKQKWGFWAVIFVSVTTIIFDIWGITIQTTAAMGFVVPVLSICHFYLKTRGLE
ncbi:hypothetical protein DRN58_06390 [Thermococci archaeon]|nr:MAG: hypothetical protein DRN58_06390 [Thermococci archaeon]